MKFKTHWSFQHKSHKNWKDAIEMLPSQIIELASELRDENDVIYTYHPNYMTLGARVAFWGVKAGIIGIDIQYSSCSYTTDIEIEQLDFYLHNYEEVIQKPEQFGLQCEE